MNVGEGACDFGLQQRVLSGVFGAAGPFLILQDKMTIVSGIGPGLGQALPLGEIPEDGECAKAIVAVASDYFSAMTGGCIDLSTGEYMPL
jgi:hypothetical protein